MLLFVNFYVWYILYNSLKNTIHYDNNPKYSRFEMLSQCQKITRCAQYFLVFIKKI